MRIIKNPSEDQLKKWTDNPKNWKLGLFYFNNEDERLFPPKQHNGLGFTVNFANRKSILAFLAMMGFFIFVVYMISRNRS